MPLFIRQRGQVQMEEMPQGLGVVLQRLLRSLFQFPPPPPWMIRRMRDVPQQTQSFHVRAGDVPVRNARLQVLRSRLLRMQQRIEQLRRAFSIIIRQTVLQIPVVIHKPIRATTHSR